MQKLFSLTFYNRSNGDDCEGFHIGFFKSYEEARMVELHYRKEIAGFKDCPCDAEIIRVPVVGAYTGEANVYRYVGWNETGEFDAVDVVESNCYIHLLEAEAAYKKAQAETPRQEWALNRYTVGECDWQEGFVHL